MREVLHGLVVLLLTEEGGSAADVAFRQIGHELDDLVEAGDGFLDAFRLQQRVPQPMQEGGRRRHLAGQLLVLTERGRGIAPDVRGDRAVEAPQRLVGIETGGVGEGGLRFGPQAVGS